MLNLLLALVTLVAAQTPTKKLVIIGDSLTEGYGVSREKAYPTLLQKHIDQAGKAWRVIGSGISGSTSASAVSRIQWHIKDKPNMLILALGANDGLRGLSPNEMEKNLGAAIELAKKENITVILAGMKMPPNYGAEYTKNYEAVFPRLAKRHHIKLIPFLLENVGGQSKLNLADGIHPNEGGHEIIAKTVFNAIKGSL